MDDTIVFVKFNTSIEKAVQTCFSNIENTGKTQIEGKGKVTSKVVTIAEIVKRKIAEEGGVWHQYNNITKCIEDYKPKELEKMAGKEQESDSEFEILRTEKKWIKPIFTIVLAKSLMENYSEWSYQTNDTKGHAPE